MFPIKQFLSIRRQHLPRSVDFPSKTPLPKVQHIKTEITKLPSHAAKYQMRFPIFSISPLEASVLEVALLNHLVRVFVFFLVHFSESRP